MNFKEFQQKSRFGREEILAFTAGRLLNDAPAGLPALPASLLIPFHEVTSITWDAASIDTWIANPRAIVPTTRMTYAGMSDPKDRTDLIAYLKIATSPLL